MPEIEIIGSRRRDPYWWTCAGLALLVIIAALLSLVVGRGGSLLLPGLDSAFETEVGRIILYELRLPRAFLGMIVGATLGLCGAGLQGLLRNPLAEPGLVGASSGAALGAVIVFYFGLGSSAFFLPAGGLIGAITALALLYLLAGKDPNIMTLILSGVAINAFAGALTSLALNLAPSPFAALEIVFWLLGSLEGRSADHILFGVPPIALGLALVASTGRALDALTLGEDTAQSLGFNVTATKLKVIGGTGLAVGAAVSITGMIGFVGLVVPHLLRPFVGQQPSQLLLPSALGGATLTLIADVLVRLPSAAPELKIGVVTAIIGAPFFLFLILKTRRDLA